VSSEEIARDGAGIGGRAAGRTRWRPRIGIRELLLAVNAFALLVPLAAILLLRIFDDQLIRRTEAQLIGQSVLIAEAWREAWLREQGIGPDDAPAWMPSSAEGRTYFALEPILRLDQGVLPPTPEPTHSLATREGPAWRAGRVIEPVIQRAVRMNLSSARVLDAEGCVVASSGSQLGACLGDLAEVRQALAAHREALAAGDRRLLPRERRMPRESDPRGMRGRRWLVPGRRFDL